MLLPALPSSVASPGPVSIGSVAAVAVGGAAGTAVRHGVSTIGWQPTLTVLLVNVVGSFALGLVVGRPRRSGPPDRWTAFGGVGFCGGLTTFSTHAVDLAQRLDDQQWSTALLSLATTVVLCVVGAASGVRLARGIAGGRST